MAATSFIAQQSQTYTGTGGIVYDLEPNGLVTSPPPTISSSTNSAQFAEVLVWISEAIDLDTSFTTFSTGISAASLSGSIEYRWRLQRVDSGGSVVSSGSYSSTYSTTGIKTATLGFGSSTWSTGDKAQLSLEARRSGGHGNVTIEVSIESSNTFADLNLSIPAVNGDLSSSYSNYSFSSSGDFTSNTVTGDLASSYSNFTADFSGTYDGIPETEKLYYRETQTEPGTGAGVYDLSTTPPSSEFNLISGSSAPTSFTKFAEFQKTIGDRLSGVDITTSAKLDVDTVRAQSVRWRINKIDSGGSVQLTSSYSQTYNTDGIKTETLSLPTTWSSGDRINIEFEHLVASDDGSGSSYPLLASTDSYIEIIVPTTVTGDVSTAYSNYQFSSSATYIAEVTGDFSTSYSNYAFSSTGAVGVAGDLSSSYSNYSFSASADYISPVTGGIITSYGDYSFSSTATLVQEITGNLSSTYQSSDVFSSSADFDIFAKIKSAAEIKNISQIKI